MNKVVLDPPCPTCSAQATGSGHRLRPRPAGLTTLRSELMTPETIKAALEKAKCDNMRRAWRNRTNVTHWQWVAYARELLGNDVDLQKVWELAACLYVACAWYTSRAGGETFIGKNIPERGWALIGLLTEDFLEDTPDRALTRGAWEQQKEAEALARKAARRKPQ